MFNSGQICTCLKRLYVHSSQYDEMLEILKGCAESKLKTMGDGMTEGMPHGPLNNMMQRDRIEELVNDAKADGARIVAGGARANPEGFPDAFFMLPLLLPT